jgi:glycosyltransferase involved in cell wall biosynthesis
MGWLRIAFCALFVAKDLRYVDTASPNKVFDAFAAGTPVLQTTQGWIKNLLERENCGVTVPPYQAEEQARALVRLAQDSEYRARLAANALRVARDQFDRGLLAARMASVLASAARRNEFPG